jgi:nitrate reductase gamma subunit
MMGLRRISFPKLIESINIHITKKQKMNLSYGAKSLVAFGLSLLFLILLTLFESRLTSLSFASKRIVSFVLLVLPALAGLALGIISLVRKEAKAWMGILGILLNAMFALFHAAVLSFAG